MDSSTILRKNPAGSRDRVPRQGGGRRRRTHRTTLASSKFLAWARSELETKGEMWLVLIVRCYQQTHKQTNKETNSDKKDGGRGREGGRRRWRNKTIQYRHEINATKLNFSKSKRRAIRSVSCCSSNGRRGTGETESHSKQTNRIKRKKPKKKKMNKVNKQTNKQTNRQTDKPTNRPVYRTQSIETFDSVAFH